MKKNLQKAAFQILGFTVLLLFSFCAPPREIDKITFVNQITINAEDSIPHPTKREGDAHSGKTYWRVDSINPYGLPFIFYINDSLLQKDIKVVVNAWVRIGDLTSDQKYAISLEDGQGKMLNWSEVNFTKSVSEPNKWINVIDSVTVSGSLINTPGMVLKTFSFNPNGKSTLDCDDVVLSFSKVEKIQLH